MSVWAYSFVSDLVSKMFLLGLVSSTPRVPLLITKPRLFDFNLIETRDVDLLCITLRNVAVTLVRNHI